MAQKARVPQFGKWDTEGNQPYTKVFDNARKGRTGGRMINPNDPEENPEAFGANSVPVEADSVASEPKNELSSEDARKPNESPINSVSGGRKLSSESPQHKHWERREHNNKVSRTSGGSENSFDHSPLHPHYQTVSAGKYGASSPSKTSIDGSRTAGTSRMKHGARGDDSMEKGSAVPKFGEWDENNPSSAEGYTHIFDEVRKEKQTGSTKATMITDDSKYMNSQAYGDGGSGCSCFGWFGKK